MAQIVLLSYYSLLLPPRASQGSAIPFEDSGSVYRNPTGCFFKQFAVIRLQNKAIESSEIPHCLRVLELIVHIMERDDIRRISTVPCNPLQ